MMLGRFIFGLGGENMTVGRKMILLSWFKGQELSFAFGIMISFARITSFIQGPIVERISNRHNVGYALMVGFIICVVCFFVLLMLILLDVWAAKKDEVKM